MTRTRIKCFNANRASYVTLLGVMESLMPRVSARGFHTKLSHTVNLCAFELFMLDTTPWDSVAFICIGLNFVDQMQVCCIVST